MLTHKLRLQKDRHERHASWLELFYDLVFVFVIGALVHYLEHYPTFSGIGMFMLLLLPAWWLWVDFSYYFDQFGDDDLITRICLFASMLLLLYMGLILPDIMHKAQYFNIVYGFARVLITILYMRAYRLVPEARSITAKYTISFTISLLIWATALFFIGPLKFALWGVALAIEIFNGPLVYATTKNPPRFTSHMPERFGLLLIIILGETILSVASGLQHVPLSPPSILSSILSFLIGINVWWLYFSRINDEHITHALKGSAKSLLHSYIYGYGHLFLYGGIGIIGAGILMSFETIPHAPVPDATRLILCSGVILYLVALYIVQRAAYTIFPRLYPHANLALVILCTALILSNVVIMPNMLLGIIVFCLSALSLYVRAQQIRLQNNPLESVV